MNRPLVKLAFVALAGAAGALYSPPAATQESATTPKAARVRIARGPEIERADPDFAIVRWTSNNPGGSPLHYGVVRYGTDPEKLTETTKSPIRVNADHPQTVFRVRLEGLNRKTVYYYVVESIESNGKSDGVKSALNRFRTP